MMTSKLKRLKDVKSATGKRTLGALYQNEQGELIFLARKKHANILRAGMKSISGAMQEELAGWGLTEALLMQMRTKGVRQIGILTTDTHDLYIANTKDWFDRKKSKNYISEFKGHKSANQRILLLQFFHVQRGATFIPTHILD